MAAIHDPALIDEVKRSKLELDPLDGAALQANIAGTGDGLAGTDRTGAPRGGEVIGARRA